MNLFKVNAIQAKEHIITCLQHGLVPFLTSSPGIGKSSIYKQIAKEAGLVLIDVRLSQSESIDLKGYPDLPTLSDGTKGKATYIPFDEIPIQGDPIPEGYNGFLLLLGEFNSAPRDVLAASYKVVLDRYLGAHKIHDDCYIALDGNLDTDNAITNDIGTALQSRVVTLELTSHFYSWLNVVAIPNNYDERIISFLSYQQSALNNFKPDHEDKTFACERTWEFVNKYIPSFEKLEPITPLIVGTVGAVAGQDFVTFTEVYDKLIKINDVLKDPENIDVPTKSAERWATITHLVKNASLEQVETILTYIYRFPIEFVVLAGRMLIAQHGSKLLSTKCYGQLISKIGSVAVDSGA